MPEFLPVLQEVPFPPSGKGPSSKQCPAASSVWGNAPGGWGRGPGWVEGNSLDAVPYAKRFTCISSFDLQNGLWGTALQVVRPLCKNAWG